jgi:stage V sporulation protein SpoVS
MAVTRVPASPALWRGPAGGQRCLPGQRARLRELGRAHPGREDDVGLSTGTLGVALLGTALGAIVAMPDTVGGAIEGLGRSRDPAGVALGIGAGVLKVARALLALALVRPWSERSSEPLSATVPCRSPCQVHDH